MIITNHEHERRRQRGLKESDVHFIINNGTIRGTKAMLTNKLIRKARKVISIVTRLAGKQLVVDGHVVVTAYHANSRQ